MLLWGDEVEYCVVVFEEKNVSLSLEAYKVLEVLQALAENGSSGSSRNSKDDNEDSQDDYKRNLELDGGPGTYPNENGIFENSKNHHGDPGSSKRPSDISGNSKNDQISLDKIVNSAWNPEYGRFMLEGTPKYPYGDSFDDFLGVEDNMRQRYFEIYLGNL